MHPSAVVWWCASSAAHRWSEPEAFSGEPRAPPARGCLRCRRPSVRNRATAAAAAGVLDTRGCCLGHRPRPRGPPARARRRTRRQRGMSHRRASSWSWSLLYWIRSAARPTETGGRPGPRPSRARDRRLTGLAITVCRTPDGRPGCPCTGRCGLRRFRHWSAVPGLRMRRWARSRPGAHTWTARSPSSCGAGSYRPPWWCLARQRPSPSHEPGSKASGRVRNTPRFGLFRHSGSFADPVVTGLPNRAFGCAAFGAVPRPG